MDRQKNESARAYAALRDYAALGPARSLRKLLTAYEAQAAKGLQPPSTKWTTITTWSVRYDWVARVQAWDKEIDEEAERAVKAARLLLAQNAGKAAEALVAVLASDDESQKRLAAGDVLDRVGIGKNMTVEVEAGDDTDDWIERVGELLGKVLTAGSSAATAGES